METGFPPARGKGRGADGFAETLAESLPPRRRRMQLRRSRPRLGPLPERSHRAGSYPQERAGTPRRPRPCPRNPQLPRVGRFSDLPHTPTDHSLRVQLPRSGPAAPVHCEATGGGERPAVAAFHRTGIRLTVLSPARIRPFARARASRPKLTAWTPPSPNSSNEHSAPGFGIMRRGEVRDPDRAVWRIGTAQGIIAGLGVQGWMAPSSTSG